MKSILNTDLSHLSIGGNVDIQRSDGRVHSAVVRSVDKKKLTVTVEWYENKETKGKEIDFGRIFELNPFINYNVIGSRTPFSEDSSLNFSDDIDAKTIITKSKSISRALPVLKNSGRNNRHISFNMIKLTNMSFSMVNSSFGWIKGNGYKSPLRHSSCAREEEKSLKNKSRLLPKSNIVEKNFDQLNPNFDFLKMIRDYQRSLNYSPLTSQDVVEKHQICVCVRKRPLNRKESIRNEIDVISIPNKQSVVVHEPKLKVDLTKYLDNQLFRFDYAFDENVDNTIVYRFTAKPLVECLFERGMATCFAYGQTGSGKTHTMGGEFQCKGIQNCSNGIYALAARDVFRLLNTKYRIENLYVECAFFEIYGGKVYDLLNKKDRLRILEDHRGKVQIVGLKSQIVDNVEEVLKIIHDGMVNRVSGQTFANQNSSRSHAVFQIILRKKIGKKLYGKFSLIDLAGNERGADTSSSNKVTRMEGAEINKSLLALKECIRALGKKGTHRPFRASKLTQVLRDSFIGDQSQTCMISTISPGMQSYEHTLNTLRYADRVKELGPGSIDDNNPIQSSKFLTSVNSPGNQEFLKKINLEKPLHDATKINEERLIQLDAKSINVLEKKNEPNNTDDIEIIVEEVDDEEKTLQNDDIDITTPKNSEMSCIADICYYIQNEKELIQQHSSLTEKLPKWLQEHNKLYKMTEYGEMNVSDYASNLGSIISDQINELIQFKAKVSNIRTRFQNVDSKRY